MDWPKLPGMWRKLAGVVLFFTGLAVVLTVGTLALQQILYLLVGG